MSREFPLATWLAFAATPTFAFMALMTGLHNAEAGVMVCPAMPGGSPLSGMAVMYLLMSGFHAAPWVRLVSDRRRSSH